MSLKRVSEERSNAPTPRGTKKSRTSLDISKTTDSNENGINPTPVSFGRVPVTESRLLAELNTTVGEFPVHAYVNAEAVKLFEEVTVSPSSGSCIK